jgi:hypothetical protein
VYLCVSHADAGLAAASQVLSCRSGSFCKIPHQAGQFPWHILYFHVYVPGHFFLYMSMYEILHAYTCIPFTTTCTCICTLLYNSNNTHTLFLFVYDFCFRSCSCSCSCPCPCPCPCPVRVVSMATEMSLSVSTSVYVHNSYTCSWTCSRFCFTFCLYLSFL